MAILIAGSVQLLRLSSSSSNSAKVFTPGQSATVGDVEVTLTEVIVAEGLVSVRLESASAQLLPRFPIDLWTQQVGSTVSAASIASSECGEVTSAGAGVRQECELSFPESDADTTYVRFSRDGAVATWVVES
jgi:hypothetical protein